MPCSQAPSQDEDLFKPGNKADSLRNTAVRVLCADKHPDHDPICTFLREARFEQAVEAVPTFFQNEISARMLSPTGC
jgi:hypothetical protein